MTFLLRCQSLLRGKGILQSKIGGSRAGYHNRCLLASVQQRLPNLLQQQPLQAQTTNQYNNNASLSLLLCSPPSSLSFSSVAAEAIEDEKQEERELVTYLKLNNLRDNPGAIKKKRRVGRGIGSSKGKTCGKGHKGQRARNKSSIPTGFEGGQTKFYKLMPKRGFVNKEKFKYNKEFIPVNLGTIQDYIDMGRFQKLNDRTNEEEPVIINVLDMMEAGMLKKQSSILGVKLLAKGKERFNTPNVHIQVNMASKSAIDAVEGDNDKNENSYVTTIHYNRLAMRALVRPDKFVIQPKRARPPPKYQQYYASYTNRGYLCPQVQLRNWLLHRNSKNDDDDKQSTDNLMK